MKTSVKACAVRAKCDLESPRGVCMIRQCSERLRDTGGRRGGLCNPSTIHFSMLCKVSFPAPVRTIESFDAQAVHV